ncbi:MAG: beta strand repeat-containing protein, partial [Leptospirales bacterium]
GTTPSTIDGKVASNGILYFMNPNGLIFGSGSTVSASGVMAFGSATPWGTPTGAVTNAGVLTATNNGTVALVGSQVTNSGTITAPGGEVLLAAGSTVTPLSTTGVSSLSVATTGGGQVDDSGVLSAETVGGKTGTILLQSGMGSGTTTLEPTAVLDASAPNGGNGGSITVDGHTVVLDETAPLNVSAPYGTTGTITIDPTYTYVGTASALETIDSSQTSYLNNSSVCIVLTANINLASGSTPYNWVPLGTSSTSAFTGTFNGNGHTVSGYTIGTSTSNYSGCDVGFIGYLGEGGTVMNLGVAGTVYASGANVGGVVGYNYIGTVEHSYNTGAVSGVANVGGVVGYNYAGTVKCSYNTGAVSGGGTVGGVVGCNVGNDYYTGMVGVVEISYNTGAVTGGGGGCKVGGVVGWNFGTVELSYNTGAVSGLMSVGGVVGGNEGFVIQTYNTGAVKSICVSGVGGVVGWNCNNSIYYSRNYYDTSTFSGPGTGAGSGGGATGIAGSCFGNASSQISGLVYPLKFNVWGSGHFLYPINVVGSGLVSATYDLWYEGTVVSGSGTINAPMLVADLPTATVTGNSGSSSYSGSTVTAGYSATSNMGATTLTPNVTVTTSVGPNAGTYTNTPTVSISAPTTQTSVDSVSVVSGTWTIAPASLGFTGSIANPTKVYDGTTTATLTTGNSSASLSGFVNGQNATYSGATGTYGSANAASNISVNATLGTGNFTTSGTGFSWSNYTVPTMTLSGTGTITPAPLTVTANAASMTYGGTVPSVSGSVTGFVNGQTLSGDSGSASWSTSATSTSNAGQYAIAGNVTLGSPYSGDYTVLQGAGNATALTIGKADLTATANPASMTYGSTVPTLSGSVTGFVNGQTLASDGGLWSTTATSSSSAGSYGISLSLVSPYSGDYTITNVSGNSTALTIGKADLTATATPASMPYGGTVPTLSGSVTGFVNGQTLASDGGLWSTTATSSSSGGSYGIDLSLASPYSGDYTIINAFGNATAFTIAGGITGKQIVPVVQTVGSVQSLSSFPETSGTTGNTGSAGSVSDSSSSSTNASGATGSTSTPSGSSSSSTNTSGSTTSTTL